MDILSLILACSLFADDQLVAALIHVHSSGNPHFVTDASAVVTIEPPPPDLPTAKTALGKIHDQHGKPLLGLMAVPASQAAAYGRKPEDLFDPCENVAIGSAMLSEFAYECSGVEDRPTPKSKVKQPPAKVAKDAERPRLDLRPCIIRKYALVQEHRAVDYLSVFNAAVQMALNQPVTHEDPPPQRSSIFPDGSDDAAGDEWSSEQLFFSAGSPPVKQP